MPEDISVMGYDGIKLTQMTRPRLTTYQQDTVALGRTAASKLVELIEQPRTTIIDRILVPGRLLTGDTLREMRKEV